MGRMRLGAQGDLYVTPIHENVSQDGSTPLTAAAWGGHLEIVKLLLAHGANIEAQNHTVRIYPVVSLQCIARYFFASLQHGWNALISAASRGNEGVCRFLLEKRANSLVLDVHEYNAADYARQNNHENVALLIEKAMEAQLAEVRFVRARHSRCVCAHCVANSPAQGYTPTSKPAGTSHWTCTDSCTVS